MMVQRWLMGMRRVREDNEEDYGKFRDTCEHPFAETSPWNVTRKGDRDSSKSSFSFLAICPTLAFTHTSV